MSKQSPPKIWEGMAAGIVGRLVTSYIIGEFQNLWARYVEENKAKSAAKKTRKMSKKRSLRPSKRPRQFSKESSLTN